MLFEDSKILDFDENQKSYKAPFIMYPGLECLIEKINGCKNNPENSSTWWSSTGLSKKAPYFVFHPKVVFYNFFPYFSGGVDSRPGRFF